jgi:soluble P-type ATPase
MITIDIPGSQKLELEHLVLDYNGTIACDGLLIPGVKDILINLSRSLTIYVLTADTFGGAQKEMQGIPCETIVIPKENQAEAKADYVRKLGANHCACAGNGRNDALMLKEAALGIAVIQTEGAAMEAILSADVVTQNILDALDLMRRPLRLAATLRC